MADGLRMPSWLSPPSRNTLLFVSLALLWYSSSFLSSSTSKALLSGKKIKVSLPAATQDDTSAAADPASSTSASTYTTTTTTIKGDPLFPYPVSLTALQFFFVFTFSYLLSSPTVAGLLYKALGRPIKRDANTGRPSGIMSTLTMVSGTKLREMMGLSVFNVTGHAMTAAAIQMVPVSTVHTVKALSPLFTVLSYVFILKLSYPLRTYVSLGPLTLGVIFACSGLSSIEGPKAWLGVALSVGSTIVFVAQNLWSKKLLGHTLSGAKATAGSDAVKLDKLNILFWSSGVSMILMIPMLLWYDIPRMLGSSTTVATTAAAATKPEGLATGSTPMTGAVAEVAGKTWKIIRLLLSNGIVHFSQNLLAFSVLGLTSPVTYSIASLFKRVFVICFAILSFGQTVTKVQWLGIVLTFIGLYLYNDSKQRPTSSGSAGLDAFGMTQTVGAHEEDAAQDFGMDKGSRRRAGLLPLSGASGANGAPAGGGAPVYMNGSAAGLPTGGPIWKGMSSNQFYSGSGGGTGAMGGSSHMNGNGYQHHHGSNGHAGPPKDLKEGPKRD